MSVKEYRKILDKSRHVVACPRCQKEREYVACVAKMVEKEGCHECFEKMWGAWRETARR